MLAKIGNPPREYFLDLDTGSDLVWLQCDAPCSSCAKVGNEGATLNKSGQFQMGSSYDVINFFVCGHAGTSSSLQTKESKSRGL